MDRLINELRKIYNIRNIDLYTGLNGSYRILLSDIQWVDVYIYNHMKVYKMILYTKGTRKLFSIKRSFSELDLHYADIQVNIVVDDINVLLEEQGDNLHRPIDDLISVRSKFEDNLYFECDWSSSIDPSDTNDTVICNIPANIYSPEDDKVVYNFKALCGSKKLVLSVEIVMISSGLFSINQLKIGNDNLLVTDYTSKLPSDLFEMIADILSNVSNPDISLRSDILMIIFAISNATK